MNLNEIIKFFAIGFFLTACVSSSSGSLSRAVSVITDDDNIRISSPSGFCVDQRTTQKSQYSTTIFVVDCIDTPEPNSFIAARRPITAIFTVTISEANGAEFTDIESLKEFFSKKPGINFLSRSKTNTVLKVHQVDRLDDILLYKLEQRTADIGVAQALFFWRAFFFLEERLISISANSFSDSTSAQLKIRDLTLKLAKNIFYEKDSKIEKEL
ncbi:MAG: hypothetical protein VYE27_02330 [Pseudomonadota bacterium]|nr:hypothetical protein [Pseudomonadota bacterium]